MRATLITLLLVPCSVWAVLGQQSKGIKVSIQGGERRAVDKNGDQAP
jgi:hypothetical protein